MSDGMIFREWKRRRRDVKVPADFADCVMRAVEREGRPARESGPGIWWRVFSPRLARAALIAAGLFGGLVKIGSVIAFFFGSCLEVQGGRIW